MRSSRMWVYTGLVALILGFLWYLHWSGVREGQARAEEQRHQRVVDQLMEQRKSQLALLALDKARTVRADISAQTAQAHRLQAQDRVHVLSDTTVRVRRDSGSLVVTIPPEVISLLRADSAVIAAKDVQIAARDTSIARADTIIVRDTVIFVQKDSVTESHQSVGGKATAVTVAVISVVIAVLTLLHR